MKTSVVLVGLVMLALGGGAAWAEEPAAEVPAPQQTPSLDAFLDSLAPVATAPVCESTVALPVDPVQDRIATASGCGKPECRRDKDCDPVCGEGFGVCEPDDTSCHTPRCLCLG